MEPDDIDILFDWIRLPAIMRAHMIASKAWVGLVEGKIVAASGIMEQWPGYGKAWLTFGDPKTRDEIPLRVWAGITERVREGIIQADMRRLEVYVDSRDEQAIRWAERLGFERESLARKYLPDGADAYIYVILGG